MKNKFKVLGSITALTSMLLLSACGGSNNNKNSDNNPEVENPDMNVEAVTMNIVEVASSAGTFNTLVTALQATGLDSVLADENGSFTVFAPTDAAFALLGEDTINALLADTDTLSNILLYHVVSGLPIDAETAVASVGSTVETANGQDFALSLDGSNLLVNFSTVTSTDIIASNGIIHVIDTVLLPPAEISAPTMNIVETAIDNGSFTTLVTALQVAGLDGTLADESQTFTVFAPTDAAFDLIGEETLNALIADVPALTNVLLQHVIIGSQVDSVTALSLNGTSVNTAANDDVTLNIVDGTFQVQGSTVSVFDVYTSNGVIHVIDAVITETLE